MKYSDHKTKRVDLAKAIPLVKPFTLLIEPICACNFRCKYCYYSLSDINKIMPSGRMRTIELNKILKDLVEWDGDLLKVVRIIGFGEPMLHKDLGMWIKYIKEARVTERIEITSNCSILTPELSRQMIQWDLDYLRVSIYGGTQRKFETVTKSKIKLSYIYNNIKNLQTLKRKLNANNPYVYIKMLDNGDVKENDYFFTLFSEVSDEIALEKPHSWLNGGVGSRMVCPQPFKMLSVRWNGEVIVCDPDYSNHTCVGNAFRENIRDIWYGNRLREFQQMQLEGRRHENMSCRNCSFIDGDYVMDNIDCLYTNVMELKKNDRT